MRTRVDGAEPDDSEPEQPEAWIAAGFEPGDAEIWRNWRFTIARAESWVLRGVADGLEAAQWMAAGVEPTTVETWRDAGIDAGEAAQWHELGYDLDGATAETARGRGPAEAFAQAQSESRRRSPSGAATWVSRGPLVAGGASSTIEPRGDPWAMHGYHLRHWLGDDAMAWASQGIEAADAYTWHALGLTPAEAGRLVLRGRGPGDVIGEWWRTGIPFDEVADWIGAGLTSSEAVTQRSRGVTADMAAALRALRRQEPGPTHDTALYRQLLTPQGPPGSTVPGPPPEDEAAARSAVDLGADTAPTMITRRSIGRRSTSTRPGSSIR